MSLISIARLAAVATLVATLGWLAAVSACPFCETPAQTFSEELGSIDVAVIARALPAAAPAKPAAGAVKSVHDVEKTRFEIIQVIKGEQALGKTKEIEVLFFGQQPKGTKFLIMGVQEPPQVVWNAPVPLSERGVEYIAKLLSVPEKGAARLKFFQDHLEDPDDMLARDAYDEFAKAPYSEVKDLKPHMKHDQLLQWIADESVLSSRRRLYLCMLGVCGTPDDARVLEEMITREEPDNKPKLALDAIVACYLTLKGPAGMPLVEDTFLKNQKAEYSDTYAAIMALRFHGQEENIIPKARLLQGLRHMLDRPTMADIVIPDLARWQDWSAMDRLVTLFKNADEKTGWVRVPVVQYLRACPLPEAKEQIAALEKIDPDSVKRASLFVPIGAGAASKPVKNAPVDVAKGADAAAGTEKAKEPEASDSQDQAPAAAASTEAAAPQQPAEAPDEGKPALVPPPATKVQGNAKPQAAVNEGNPQAAPPPGSPVLADIEISNSKGLVFVPVGVGVVLFILLLVILRGVGGPATSEVKA